MDGWIKLHRKILEWEWWDDPNTFRVFLWLLLKANHADSNWHGMIIKRGQLVTSYENCAKGTSLTVSKIRTIFDKLNGTELTRKITNKYQIITITNYDFYQHDDRQIAGKLADKSQSNRNQIATNNNDNNEKNNNDNTRAKDLLSRIDEILRPAIVTNTSRLDVWLKAGMTDELILETIRRVVSKARSPDRINSLNYFEDAMAIALADSKKPMEIKNGTSKHSRFGEQDYNAGTEGFIT